MIRQRMTGSPLTQRRLLGALLAILTLCIAAGLLVGCDGDDSGAPAAATPAVAAPPSYLFVHQAQSGTLEPSGGGAENYVLTLDGVAALSTWFTDRPLRKTGTVRTGDMVGIFQGRDMLPTAALEIPNGGGPSEIVAFSIRNATYDESSSTVQYQVSIMTGDRAQLIPRYSNPNTSGSVDDDTTADFIDDEFPGEFGLSTLFIDNLTGLEEDTPSCTNAIPIAPIDPLEVYDYGDGIETYDPCCTLENPELNEFCITAGITLSKRPGCKRTSCLDVDGNELKCGPTVPCVVEGEFCNKFLASFECCNFEE